MTDDTIQKKLDQLTKIANDLDAEAKRRYGPKAFLFFEAGGHFHLMDGDCDGGSGERQKHIRFSSKYYCTMGGGAW
jgi:hypothetical protein